MQWVRRSLPAVLVIGLAVLLVWLTGNATFRFFFGWPAGGTWSNLIEQIEAACLVLFFRDRIGKRLAVWLRKHDPLSDHTQIAAEVSQSVHRMVADLYAHITGEIHPEAPQ